MNIHQDLYADRLFLRVLRKEDISDIHHLHSIPETLTYNTLPPPKLESETAEFMHPILEDLNSEEPKKYFWTIRMKDSNEFIGEIGLNLGIERFKRGEIYYNLLQKYWGKGFATEAASRLLKFGFEELKLHRIEAGAAIENIGSIKVLEKVGMIREGQHRKILPIRGEWKDNYHYAILEEEYFKQNREAGKGI